MAATNRSIDYDALLTMTADNYYKAGVIHDGVFESNPTFSTLRAKGFRKEEVGGSKIQVNLMYGKNDTVKSYSRYEPIDVSPQDGFTPAFFDWTQYPGSVSIDGLSEFQNMGKPQIQKLLREKVQQLTMSFAEKMNEDIWDIENVSTGASGNNGKNINSIPFLVQYTPTSSMLVGLINQADEAWWRNRTKISSGDSFGDIESEMTNLANMCSRGSGGAPDLFIADQYFYEQYEKGMNEKVRYSHTDTASMGFENISFKGGKLFWDINVPDAAGTANGDGDKPSKGTMYALNSKYLDLCIGKGKDFVPLGFQRPANQDARVGLWVFYGQLVVSNRRKHGVLGNVDLTL